MRSPANYCFRLHVYLSRAALALLLMSDSALAGGGTIPPPLTICLLSASAEYESDKSLSGFQEFLEANYRILCRRAFGRDKGDSLPGLEALDTADLMIVYTRRVTLPAVQAAHLRNYLASGKPVIGLRTASHGFQNLPEFDREILGGGYKGHFSDVDAQVQIAPGRIGHPVLSGVAPLRTRKLYKNPSLADDAIVLLDGLMGDHREPVAWVRQATGRRVFYTSLGTQDDFTHESFRRLLVNAIFWVTQREETAFRLPSDAGTIPSP